MSAIFKPAAFVGCAVTNSGEAYSSGETITIEVAPDCPEHVTWMGRLVRDLYNPIEEEPEPDILAVTRDVARSG
jgi:hypothetical protein